MSLAKFIGVVLAQVLIPLLEFYRGKITSDELKERVKKAIDAIDNSNSKDFEKAIGSSNAGKFSGRGKLRPHQVDTGNDVERKQQE